VQDERCRYLQVSSIWPNSPASPPSRSQGQNWRRSEAGEVRTSRSWFPATEPRCSAASHACNPKKGVAALVEEHRPGRSRRFSSSQRQQHGVEASPGACRRSRVRGKTRGGFCLVRPACPGHLDNRRAAPSRYETLFLLNRESGYGVGQRHFGKNEIPLKNSVESRDCAHPRLSALPYGNSGRRSTAYCAYPR
jgi:hypothetical protein